MNLEILNIEDAKKIGAYNKIKKYIYAEINKAKYNIRTHKDVLYNIKLLDKLEKMKEIIEN